MTRLASINACAEQNRFLAKGRRKRRSEVKGTSFATVVFSHDIFRNRAVRFATEFTEGYALDSRRAQFSDFVTVSCFQVSSFEPRLGSAVPTRLARSAPSVNRADGCQICTRRPSIVDAIRPLAEA